MEKIELLAPAGSIEAYLAAVENGADIVYIGGRKFNARENAKNFDNKEIILVTEHAHEIDKKVYVAFNTIIRQDELQEAADYLYFLSKNKVDAVIVQDMGLIEIAGKFFPSLNLNSSTQMTVCDFYAAEILQKNNIKKIILSREVPIRKITEIRNKTECELEVFIHGALCCSYSGQCYMSSMWGGRSGNRGKCAQPCRLSYDLISDEEKPDCKKPLYPLSMKELSVGENILLLAQAGINTAKIEGRMRKPSYVGAVTKYYRNIIDGKHFADEKKDAENVFSRGFTEGLIFGKFGCDIIAAEKPGNSGEETGKVINSGKYGFEVLLTGKLKKGDGIAFLSLGKMKGFTVSDMQKNKKNTDTAYPGEIIYLTSPYKPDMQTAVIKTGSKQLTEKYGNYEEIKLPVSAKVKLLKGQKPEIGFYYKDLSVNISGDEKLEKAVKGGLSSEFIEEQVSKLGDSSFCLAKCQIEYDKDAFISRSEINKLRREAISVLEKKMFSEEKNKFSLDFHEFDIYAKKIEFSLKINTGNIPDVEILDLFSRIYLPYYYAEEKNMEKILKSNADIYIALSDIGKSYDYVNSKILLEKYRGRIKGVLVDNIDGLGFASYYEDLEICTDYTMNIFNSFAVDFLKKENVKSFTHSIESDFKNIENINLHSGVYNECIIYGRLPLMSVRNCPLSVVKGCIDENMCSSCNAYEKTFVCDRKGMKMRMERKCGITKIFNPSELFMLDRIDEFKGKGIDLLRIEIDGETDIQLISDIISGKNENIIKPEYYTRGFYYRNIS